MPDESPGWVRSITLTWSQPPRGDIEAANIYKELCETLSVVFTKLFGLRYVEVYEANLSTTFYKHLYRIPTLHQLRLTEFSDCETIRALEEREDTLTIEDILLKVEMEQATLGIDVSILKLANSVAFTPCRCHI